MTARFAGSSTLDARRRRRLATDPDHLDSAAAAGATSDAEGRDPLPETGDDDSLPAPALETWMPRAAWKAWLLVLLGVLVAAGVVAVGDAVDRDPGFYGPELAGLMSLQSGRLVRTVGSVLLLLSGQLALVVWWARSRSTQDFSGRYDVWVWTAAAWFLFALGHETQAHLAWNEMAALVWEPDFWNKTILSWFAPAVAAGGVLWLSARADAGRCRSAKFLLTLAGLAWVAAGLLALGVGSRWLSPWLHLLVPATAMAGHVLGFSAMLIHARFVTYVSNDPPTAHVRKAKTKRMPKLVDEGVESQPSAIEPIETAEPVEKPTRRSTRQAPAKTRSTKVEEPAAEESKAVDTPPTKPETAPVVEEVVEDRPAKPAASSPTPSPSVEDGPPPEMLRGLSKRQKKRIRREWREQHGRAA